ncbi:hypothetical protein H8E88_01545 [candidate division KSB1 bacterium]|nr:hypothetical protein [candidate division KSB1 bacterium]
MEAFKTFAKERKKIPRYFLIGYLVVTICLLVVPQSAVTYHKVTQGYQKEDWAKAVDYLTENSKKGDYLVFFANFGKRCFDYYFTGCEATSPENFQKESYYNYITIPRVGPRVESAINQVISAGENITNNGSIWLVYFHVWDPGDGVKRNAIFADDLEAILLKNKLNTQSVWQGNGILIKSYKPGNK